MPLMDVHSPRRAPIPSYPTSEPPPVKVPSVGKRPLRLQRRQYLSACVIILPHLLFVFVFNSAYLPPRRATKRATTLLKPRADAVFVEASAPAPLPAPETGRLPTVCAILSLPANTHAFSFIFSPSLKLTGFRHVDGQTRASNLCLPYFQVLPAIWSLQLPPTRQVQSVVRR